MNGAGSRFGWISTATNSDGLAMTRRNSRPSGKGLLWWPPIDTDQQVTLPVSS